MPLSIDERVQLILLSGNGRTHREIADAFSRLHPERKPISHATVGNLLTKFRETGSVHDRGKPLPRSGSGSPSSDQAFELSANERETSASSTCGATHNQKRYRYAVVDIKNRSSDDLYDLLINNGFSDFLLLNELTDHPDIEVSCSCP
ncbi:hypothetical protein GCK32_019740 [Trichostrongylus colubriformis]|uniref:DUF4817 domain-containing protein n=1 Tax=Trichostrongylus colubriformis TaxID=6319 RepID=A0AAN8G7X7_TRICO